MTVTVKHEWKQRAWCNLETYHLKYATSVNHCENFWAEEAKRLEWIAPAKKIKNVSYTHPVHIGWFEGGKLNVCVNCVDRHLPMRGNQVALIWEPDNPKEAFRSFTYQMLYEEVCRFANVLKSNGVRKGDRVTLYLPMIPEAIFAMLACARIGAMHSVVFAGFSPEALAGRVNDCESSFLITADEGRRGGKTIPLKENVELALLQCPSVKKVLVIAHTHAKIAWNPARDIAYHDAREKSDVTCPAEIMDSEDPLFLLYTSGSTGKPKGVLHTSAGYLLYAAFTHQFVFDYHDGDVYWCTADIGWITGHSYVVYGPLTNGATTLLFEGVPTWPSAARNWEIVDKHQVNIFYSSPTAIRSLMQQGNDFLETTHRDTLKVLGVVGEPTNPAAWEWYYEKVGKKRCPIVDTWWQTETGGILISPLPGATPLKPGSATLPFFGIEPILFDEKGHLLEGAGKGALCIKDSWPGQARTLYKDHARFESTYFSQYPGFYFTGDGSERDEDGYFWITGRMDDVINVAGHRLGTAEIESALVAHSNVAESAVVGFPHAIKGQGIYAFVVLKKGEIEGELLRQTLIKQVRDQIGPIATIDSIQFAEALPKTRSGKIMRRILRKIAEGNAHEIGDVTTLSDPAVVDVLIKNATPR